MAIVNNKIKAEEKIIYVGDLVSWKGKVGLLCELIDANGCENFCIVGFDGKTIKNYDDYVLVDVDTDVQLLCKRNELVIDLSKRGV